MKTVRHVASNYTVEAGNEKIWYGEDGAEIGRETVSREVSASTEPEMARKTAEKLLDEVTPRWREWTSGSQEFALGVVSAIVLDRMRRE